jgi:hypothetical protein
MVCRCSCASVGGRNRLDLQGRQWELDGGEDMASNEVWREERIGMTSARFSFLNVAEAAATSCCTPLRLFGLPSTRASIEISRRRSVTTTAVHKLEHDSEPILLLSFSL